MGPHWTEKQQPNKTERVKRNHYQQYCQDNDLHLLPLIFETYGRWGPELEIFVKQTVNKTMWERRGKSIKFSVLNDSWVKRLSVCLQIMNSKMLNSRALSAAGGDILSRDAKFNSNIRVSEVRVNYSVNRNK